MENVVRPGRRQTPEPISSNAEPQPARWPLAVILTLGLLLRLVLVYTTHDTGLKIVDEQHYHTLALNLTHGHGFAWEPGKLTSIRPPLYPFFITTVWKLTGTESLVAVRLAQVFLSLCTAYLLYRLGALLYNRRVALLAATGLCFYPSLAAFNVLLLSETLFTLLLTLLALGYVGILRTEKAAVAWGTGCVLGLAALTRSILWPFPIILCPLTFFSIAGKPRKRLGLTVCLFLGYAMVITPWAMRNTRLQGVFTTVDAMGGITLRMGNYEHTMLYRAWDPMTLHGENSIFEGLQQKHPESASWTEGQKAEWTQQQALEYMAEHPWLTLKRSAIKLANFWGLERTIIAGWQQGLYRPSGWVVVLGTVVIPLVYVVVILLASLGLWLARPRDVRTHVFLLAVVLFICALHMLTFGHSRYHLPLVPYLLLYAAAAVVQRSWEQLREGASCALVPAVVWLTLLGIWGREVLSIDASRIRVLLQRIF